jgi:hypothetical protein
MEHRHSGKKFKSRVRHWYTYQNPRIGRDYIRDISPDKIPWKYIEPPTSLSDVEMTASTDTMALDFVDDSDIVRDKEESQDGYFEEEEPVEEEDIFGAEDWNEDEEEQKDQKSQQKEKKKKKKKKKKKGEEEEEKRDPFFFEDEEDDDDFDW